jgi:hypothetical protein
MFEEGLGATSRRLGIRPPGGGESPLSRSVQVFSIGLE